MKEVGDRYSYEIEQDEYPMNPREWDNLSLFALGHRRYDLPNDWDINFDDFDSWEAVADHIETLGGLHITRVYALVHSDITIRTSAFSCPWDSGTIGFAFTTEDQMKMMGTPAELVKEVINQEVEQFNQYLQGDCWVVFIKDNYDDGAVVDSTCVMGSLEARMYAGQMTYDYNKAQPKQLLLAV